MTEWNLFTPKKHYPFLAKYLFSLSTTKGVDAYNVPMKICTINLVEVITIRSKKQTSILIFFFIVKYFLWHAHVVLDLKSLTCSYSKYSLFPHHFCQKMSTCTDRAKKNVKSLKIENFDQTSEERTTLNSGPSWPDSWVSTIWSLTLFKERQRQKYEVEKRTTWTCI